MLNPQLQAHLQTFQDQHDDGEDNDASQQTTEQEQSTIAVADGYVQHFCAEFVMTVSLLLGLQRRRWFQLKEMGVYWYDSFVHQTVKEASKWQKTFPPINWTVAAFWVGCGARQLVYMTTSWERQNWIITALAATFSLFVVWKHQKADVFDKTDNTTIAASSELCHSDLLANYQHACRLRIAKLLGAIRAPPMELEYDVVENDDASNIFESIGSFCHSLTRVNEEMVRFVESTVDLLVRVDEACHQLRVGTSLSLGLGPISPCVQRIEMLALQESTGRSSANPAQTTYGSLTRSKIILAKVLLTASHQMSNILPMLSDGEDIDSKMWWSEDDKAHTTVPHPLTLSWLSSQRWQCAEQLSDVCSFLTTKAIIVKLAFHENENLRDHLRSSTRQLQQWTQHVVSAFALCSDDGQAASKASCPPNSQQRQQLQSMRTLVDTLGVVVRNCERSNDEVDPGGLENGGGNVKSNANVNLYNLFCHKECRDRNLQQWWQHAVDLLNRIQLVKGQLDDVLSCQSEELPQDVEFEGMMLETPDANALELFEDVQVGGDAPDAVNENALGSENGSKIRVFSGLGAVPLRQRSRAKVSPKENDFKEDNERHTRRNHAMEQRLVHELAVRLRMLPQYEEVDESQQRHDVSDLNTTRPEDVQPNKKSLEQNSAPVHLFLGATGLLLDELKQSIDCFSETHEERD